MKFATVLENAVKTISSIGLAGRNAHLSRLDFGILQVALMVAALDGDVDASEIEAFKTLASKCRGATAHSIKAAFDEAMRRAGYLLLLSRQGDEKELMKAFASEALAALPTGFLYGRMPDLRRAFVTWVTMGISDGDYSDVERLAIAKLLETFADIRTNQAQVDCERWMAMSPAFRMAYGAPRRPARVKLLEDDFLTNAEKFVKGLGSASTREKSQAALVALIAG